MYKSITRKTIALALIFAFALQETLWAQPSFLTDRKAADTLAAPSLFQSVYRYEKVLESMLMSLAMAWPRIENFGLPVMRKLEEGVELFINTSAPVEKDGKVTFDCAIVSGNDRVEYKGTVTLADKKVGLARSDEKKPKGSASDGFIVQGPETFRRMASNLAKGSFSDITDDPLISSDIRSIEVRTGQRVRDLASSEEKLRVIVTDAVVMRSSEFAFGLYSHAPEVKKELIRIFGEAQLERLVTGGFKALDAGIAEKICGLMDRTAQEIEKGLTAAMLQKNAAFKDAMADALGEATFERVFPGPAIVLTKEILSNPDPLIRQEYIVHELLCHSRGHYEAIFEQQRLFPENYAAGEFETDGDGGKYLMGKKGDRTKPFKGALGAEIRNAITREGTIHDLKNKVATAGGFARNILKMYIAGLITKLSGPDGARLISRYAEETGFVLSATPEAQTPDAAKKFAEAILKKTTVAAAFLREAHGEERMCILGRFLAVSMEIEHATLDYLDPAKMPDPQKTVEDLEAALPELLRCKNEIARLFEEGKFNDTERMTANVKIIIEESDITVELINSVVNWLGWSMDEVNVPVFIEQVVEGARVNPSLRKGMTYEVDLSAVKELRDVFTYKGILRMAIEEFIKNASKYSGASKVSITVRLTKYGELMVSVADNGAGILPHIKERLFKPGVTQAVSRNVGTGFGLSTLKEIIESVGGDVAAESKPGEGSRFTVRVPLNGTLDALSKQVAPQPVIVAIAGLRGSGRRVVGRQIAGRMGLRYINVGFLMRVLTYYLVQDGVNLDDEAAVSAYAGMFFEEGRIDYSREPILIDGRSSGAVDPKDGLSLRDKIKLTINRNPALTQKMYRLSEYHGIELAVTRFIKKIAADVNASGAYQGVVLRVAKPIDDPGVVNILLDAPSYIRAKRAKTPISDIEKSDIITKRKYFTHQFPNVFVIDTTHRPTKDVSQAALEHVLSRMPVEDGVVIKGEESFRRMAAAIAAGMAEQPTSALSADIEEILKPLNAKSLSELFRTRSQVRVLTMDPVIVSKNDFTFGFYSHLPAVKAKLVALFGEEAFKNLFPEPTLVLARDIASDNRDYNIRQAFIYYMVLQFSQGAYLTEMPPKPIKEAVRSATEKIVEAKSGAASSSGRRAVGSFDGNGGTAKARTAAKPTDTDDRRAGGTLNQQLVRLFHGPAAKIESIVASIEERKYNGERTLRDIMTSAGTIDRLIGYVYGGAGIEKLDVAFDLLSAIEKEPGDMKSALTVFRLAHVTDIASDEQLRNDLEDVSREIDNLAKTHWLLLMALGESADMAGFMRKVDSVITTGAVTMHREPRIAWVGEMTPASGVLSMVEKGGRLKVRCRVYVPDLIPSVMGMLKARKFAEQFLKAEIWTNAMNDPASPGKGPWKAVKMEFTGTGGYQGHDFIFEGEIPAEHLSPVNGNGRRVEYRFTTRVSAKRSDGNWQPPVWCTIPSGDGRMLVVPKGSAPQAEKAQDAKTEDREAVRTPAFVRPEGYPYLNDIREPKLLAENLIGAMISVSLSGKRLTLAFHKDVSGCDARNVTRILKQLEDLKGKEGFDRLLKDMVIIPSYSSREELETELVRRGVDASKEDRDVVFVFSPAAEKEAALPGAAVENVRIGREAGFNADIYYYPLFEMVTIALVKYLKDYGRDDIYKILAEMKIDRESLNIKEIDVNTSGHLIFTLIPKAEKYDTNERLDKYALLSRFISSAA